VAYFMVHLKWAPSPRSGRQNKAWGASPRIEYKKIWTEPAERATALSPASRARSPFLIFFTWGLRPRLYSAVRFADSAPRLTLLDSAFRK